MCVANRLCCLLLLLLSCAPLASAAGPAPAPAAERALLELLPPDSVLVIAAHDAGRLLRALEESGVVRRLLETAAWRELVESDEGSELRALAALVEERFGTAPLALARRLLAGDTTLALVVPPHGGEPAPLIVARPREPELLAELIELAAEISEQPIERRREGELEICRTGELIAVRRAGTFLLGGHKGVLQDAAERLEASGRKASLAATEAFRSVARVWEGGAPLRALLNLDCVRSHDARAAKRLATPPADPLGNVLFGGYGAVLAEAHALAAALTAERRSLALRVESSPLPEGGPHPCYSPGGPLQGVALPADAICGVELRRGFLEWWNERATLLGEHGVRATARFASEIGNVIGSADFGGEVLAGIAGGIELLALPPAAAADSERRPEPLLPALAAVVPLADEERLGELSRVLFQTLISFLNIDRAAKGERPFIIETSDCDGTPLASAAIPTPPAGEPLGIEHNFEPAVAIAGGCLVVATQAAAARRLIRSLTAGRRSEIEDNLGITVRAPQLRAVLAANRRALVTASVLEGKSISEATRELDALLDLIGLFDRLDLRGDLAGRRLRFTARLAIAAPAHEEEF